MQNKVRKLYLFLGGIFHKTIILLALIGYEMIIANSGLWALLAIYHLISNTRSWNNYCLLADKFVCSHNLFVTEHIETSRGCTQSPLNLGVTHGSLSSWWDASFECNANNTNGKKKGCLHSYGSATRRQAQS